MPQNRPDNYNWSNIDRSRAATRRRQDQALALRNQGMSYINIAQQLGYVDANGRPKAQSAAEAVRAATRRRANGDVDTALDIVSNTGIVTDYPLLPSNRTFGFEAEFFGITPHAAERAMQAAGFPCEYEEYNHRVSATKWKIVRDQSVNGQGTGLSRGIELVSPILRGEDGMAKAVLAVNTLQAAGGRTDKSCGLHVHVGMDGLTGKQVVKVVDLYTANQQHVNKLIARSRWNNIYCQPMSNHTRNSRAVTDFDNATTDRATSSARSDLQYVDRYHAANLHAYSKYGTLEFRQHQGTLSGEKLTSWIRFLLGFVEKGSAMADANEDFGSLDGLLNATPINAETRAFLTRRAERLERSREEARNRANGVTN